MKKLYYLLLGFLLLSNLSWANKTAGIHKTNQIPAIDGVKDAAWDLAPAIALDSLTNPGTGVATVSGTWRGMWDATNVYLLFEVQDDIAMNNGPANPVWYIHDCIEMFTDMKNLKANTAVANKDGEYQLRFIYGLDNEPIYENPTWTTYKSVSKLNKDNKGYTIEVKFPWDLLTANTTVAIAEGLKIGLDFKVVDVDVPTTGDWWPSHFEFAWNSCKDKKPINFGEVELLKAASRTAVAVALPAGTTPSIDGGIDDIWATAEANSLAILSNPGTGDPTVNANWKALWDAENLYMLFEVKDDVRLNNGPANPVWYIHDCMEVFTDMKNLKNDAAVTNSDGQYQLRFIYGLDNEPIYENPTWTTYKSVSKDNAAKDGYIIEVKMPWSLLTANTSVKIEKGLKIGMDFKVTDVDVKTTGDWWPAHFEYVWNNAGAKKPINFGTVELVAAPPKAAVALSTNSAPAIDGSIDALWANAESNPVSTLSNAGNGDPTVSASYKTLWDADNLYMLFEVKDDIRLNNGPANPVWYIHDCMEVFTDMKNLKNDAAVTNKDGQYQLRFIYGLDNEPIYENPTWTTYKSVSKDNAAKDGYIIEVKMPWSLLTANTTVKIEEGLKIGMDFKVTDVDVATSGDWWPPHYEYVWNNAGGKKPLNFGTITLTKALDTEKPTVPTSLTGTLTELSASLNWKASTDNVAVTGYNIKNNGTELLATTSGTELTKTVTLKPGTENNITVTAVDAAGNESAPSNSVKLVTAGLAILPAGTNIAKASAAITIDGKSTETSWNTASNLIARVDTWAPNYEIKGQTDFSASFKGLWDETNLYLFFNISDEAVYQGVGDADNKWVTDCIEVAMAKDATSIYKYRFVYGKDNQSVKSGAEIDVPAGFKNVGVKTATGYSIEVSIPWTSIPEIKEAVKRTSKFSVTFSGLDIDKADAAFWTDVSGVIGWPYGKITDVLVLANPDEAGIDAKAPASPSPVAGEAPDYKSINLTWPASADADVLQYTIQINNKIIATTSDLSYKATGLLPLTSYECAVFANDAQNYSAISNKVNLTTKDKPQTLVRSVGIAKIDFDPAEEYESWDTITPATLYNVDRVFDAADLSAGWKAMWDTKKLYFQINVKDADIYNSAANGWENDNIELFFDMNNEHDGTSCETLADASNWQIDNFQYRFIAYDKVRQTGSQNAPIWTGVEVSFFDITTGGKKVGYTCEIAIPWTSLTSAKSDKIKFTPVLGKDFGFEIQVYDVDPFVNDKGETVYNNADANGNIHWNLQDNAIAANRNNSQFGKVYLNNVQKPYITGISENALAKNTLKVYPNPVNDILQVQIPSSEFQSLRITDLSGKQVLNRSIQRSSGYETIDVSHLVAGMYIVTVNSSDTSLRTKIVVK
jgi:hypothetical protein